MSQTIPQRQRHPFRGMGKFIKGASKGCKVEDVDAKQGLVIGYFSAFNNIDADGDYITPGAFAKTISDWGPMGDRRIKHLFYHNPTHGVGVVRELAEDGHGLRYVSKMLSTPQGKNALIELEEGHITEHSIGFDVIKARRDDDRQAFALQEIRLYEGSGVTWGANPRTPVLDIKALGSDPTILDNMVLQMKAIKRVIRREITDERAIELEDQLKSYEHFCSELRKALYADGGPLATRQESTQDWSDIKLFPDAEPQSSGELALMLTNKLHETLA